MQISDTHLNVVEPDDIPSAEQTFRERILAALINADCFCKPGDPTCNHWESAEHRTGTILDAVMNIIEDVDTPQSNLIDHARKELDLLGEDPDMIRMYLRVIREFANFGHSGGSAFCAIPVINDLLEFKNITEITDDPSEWTLIAEELVGNKEKLWQSCRNPRYFSFDGGKTYYDVNEGTAKTMRSQRKESFEQWRNMLLEQKGMRNG